jgi:hypothetical protein
MDDSIALNRSPDSRSELRQPRERRRLLGSLLEGHRVVAAVHGCGRDGRGRRRCISLSRMRGSQKPSGHLSGTKLVLALVSLSWS